MNISVVTVFVKLSKMFVLIMELIIVYHSCLRLVDSFSKVDTLYQNF